MYLLLKCYKRCEPSKWTELQFAYDHQARDLLACVDVAMILNNGKIIAEDTPSNLVKNINAKNAYFGDNFRIN